MATSLEISEPGHVDIGSDATFRRRIWDFFNKSPTASLPARRAAIAYEIFACTTVFLVFIVEIIDLEGFFHTQFVFIASNALMLCVFFIEFLLRFYACAEDPRAQALSHLYGNPSSIAWQICIRLKMAIRMPLLFDALTLAALITDALEAHHFRGFAILRFLRIFTLCRLERELHFLTLISKVLWTKSQELAATLFIAMVLLLSSALAMHYIEGPTNENYRSIFDSLWWGTAALTTVGYGDIYPTSPTGRLLGGVVAILGIGLFALPAGIIASGFQEVFAHDQQRDRSKSEVTILSVVEESMQSIERRLTVRLDSLQSEVAAMRIDQERFFTAVLRQLDKPVQEREFECDRAVAKQSKYATLS